MANGGTIPSNANNSSQYSSNRINRSSTSIIFSSHAASFASNSCILSSNAENRSHGAWRWSLRVWMISSCVRSAVARNFRRRVWSSVRSESARSSLICRHSATTQTLGWLPESTIYAAGSFSWCMECVLFIRAKMRRDDTEITYVSLYVEFNMDETCLQ